MMKQVTAIVIGAGKRGNIYVQQAIPGSLKVLGVAEPDEIRRAKFQEKHHLSEENCFSSYEDIFSKPQMADLAIICTNDALHIQPAEMALGKGYHILLEKPIATSPEEVYRLAKVAEKSDRIFSVCHVLRFTPFFKTLKGILDSGRIGRVVSIAHSENVGYWHQAHSYVRGNWRNSKNASPMILAKSCHDMDILYYLIGSKCKKISSFGSRLHFRAENAPKGAPKRCLDNCPYYDTCQFNAVRLYLNGPLKDWCKIPFNLADTQPDSIIEALKTNGYGRCVYYCDNDVVDNQVVNLQYENGATAAFTMCAFTKENNRVLRIMGTDGEIEGDLAGGSIIVKEFKTGNENRISIPPSAGGHNGGDYGIINSVIAAIKGQAEEGSAAADSLEAHMIAFAAEKSRLEEQTIDMDEFITQIKNA
jgi:Predicted dehydrogenases and related proteins